MSENSRRSAGAGRVLIVVYGILALAATGRSLFQLLTKAEEAPIAYGLSALAGLVYLLATAAFAAPGLRWHRVALGAVLFELVGVLTVGVLSLVHPEYFPDDSVWSFFGRGYAFLPLLLPFAGLAWLWRTAPGRQPSTDAPADPARPDPAAPEGA